MKKSFSIILLMNMGIVCAGSVEEMQAAQALWESRKACRKTTLLSLGQIKEIANAGHLVSDMALDYFDDALKDPRKQKPQGAVKEILLKYNLLDKKSLQIPESIRQALRESHIDAKL